MQRPRSEETAAREAGAQGPRAHSERRAFRPELFHQKRAFFFSEMMESNLRKVPSRRRGGEGCVEQVTQLGK